MNLVFVVLLCVCYLAYLFRLLADGGETSLWWRDVAWLATYS